MSGVGNRLLDGIQIAGDGDGDGSSQIRIGGLALLGHGDALDLLHRLALYVIGQSLNLFVPLLADGADLAHTVIAAQLVLGGNLGGQVGGQGSGCVKGGFCLDGVDHAGVDDPFVGHSDRHQFNIGLAVSILAVRGIFAAGQAGAQIETGFDRGIRCTLSVFRNRFGDGGRRFLRLRDSHHCRAAAGGQCAHSQRTGQDQCKQFLHL